MVRSAIPSTAAMLLLRRLVHQPAEDLVREDLHPTLRAQCADLLRPHAVSALADERHKVAISGDGADELLLGYAHFREAWAVAERSGPWEDRFAGLLSQPSKQVLRDVAEGCLPASLVQRPRERPDHDPTVTWGVVVLLAWYIHVFDRLRTQRFAHV